MSKTVSQIPTQVQGYDWDQAFGAAGDALWTFGDDYDHKEVCVDIRPGLDIGFNQLAPFDRTDIARILAVDEGERDARDWLCLGELRDGRYFYLSAGCDYTGWE